MVVRALATAYRPTALENATGWVKQRQESMLEMCYAETLETRPCSIAQMVSHPVASLDSVHQRPPPLLCTLAHGCLDLLAAVHCVFVSLEYNYAHTTLGDTKR